MKNFSLFNIVDFCFKFIILFLVNLIWSLYFVKTVWLSILLSLLLSLFILFLSWLLTKKKKEKEQPRLNEIKHANAVLYSFIYMPQSEMLQFFLKLAQIKHSAEMSKNHIVINKHIALTAKFKNSELTLDEIIEMYNSINKVNIDKIIILCNKPPSNYYECLKNFDIKTILLDFNQTYVQLLKEYNFFPKIKKEVTKAKKTRSQILNIMFNKKRTRSYVVSSLFIIFSSFFVAYRIYYLIVATVLLIFALLCQFEFKFNKVEKESLF